MRVEKEPSLAMANQTWRAFLAMNTNAEEKKGTKAARCRQESLNVILPKSDMYPKLKMRSGSKGPIVWQGKEYPPGVLPPEDVV